MKGGKAEGRPEIINYLLLLFSPGFIVSLVREMPGVLDCASVLAERPAPWARLQSTEIDYPRNMVVWGIRQQHGERGVPRIPREPGDTVGRQSPGPGDFTTARVGRGASN